MPTLFKCPECAEKKTTKHTKLHKQTNVFLILVLVCFMTLQKKSFYNKQIVSFFTSLAAVYMWHWQPWWDDDRPPDHRLRVYGYEHHRELWDARERRPPGANVGPGGTEWPADRKPGEANQRLREHLDRHPRHRQVLEGCVSRSVHPL